MPTYTYQCQACHARMDVSHGMRETPRPPCAQCGGLTRKVIGTAPTLLKNTPSPIKETPVADAHDCGSGCVLHRKPANPPTESA